MRKGTVGGLLISLLVAMPGNTTLAQAPGDEAAGSTAQLVLYDDFDGPWIDPVKWAGTWNDTTDLREAVRELAPRISYLMSGGRSLHLAMRSYANTWDDYGGFGGGFGLQFAEPAAITEVAFSVLIRKAEAVGCPTNPGMSVAVAELRGGFFNVGMSTAGSEGDVQAAITVNRSATDATGVMEVHGFYSRCDDPYCATSTNLGWGLLGRVFPGQIARLRLKWDQPNHQFVFQLNGRPPFVSPYAVSDVTPAAFPAKYIGFTRVLPNCTTPPRPMAAMDAYFDDVFVNAW
jgi:hypothetical protein